MSATLDASSVKKLDDLVSSTAPGSILAAPTRRAVETVKQLAPYSDVCYSIIDIS
jgi:hypothetical protein